MDISKLSIEFYRDFEKEFFDVPQNAYLNYEPWNFKQKFGTFPEVNFSKKDPTVLIMHKDSKEKGMDKELWLHEDNNKFTFRKLEQIKNGFDTQPPLILWVEYLKEPTFLLYKIEGIGITKKKYLSYAEVNGYIYMKWNDNMNDASIFSYGTNVDWSEYHTDLVSTQKRF